VTTNVPLPGFFLFQSLFYYESFHCSTAGMRAKKWFRADGNTAVTVHAPSRGGIIASQCSNLRSPMLNSLREWGERRSTRVFREKPAKNASNFVPV